ncbi:MAG TPA: hypothetical protein PKE16_20215 [Hyphomicrobium sp.]|nr:hypothetical protein [Hyphomicrobium sp.]
MAFISDTALDAALAKIKTATRLDICSAEPTSYADATGTDSLGNKTGITISNPADRAPDGRKVTIAAIADGAVTATGEAAFWAISDVANSVLLATGAISDPQEVTTGNVFTLAAFDVGIPDAE